MNNEEFETILRETLDDLRLSRSEKKAIRARLESVPLGGPQRIALRHVAFRLARELAAEQPPELLVDWLDEVTRVLVPEARQDFKVEAFFSPGEEPRATLLGLIRRASASIDICVFTITDNTLADELLAAHSRGVSVRVLTDNHKAEDRGSDVDRLEASGIPVVVDTTDKHMHHKFAIFDGNWLVTGSYNWTRSAADFNQENMVLTDHAPTLSAFRAEFDRLWASFDAV